MPFAISKPNFKFEWRNTKIIFIMKNLELNQMEKYEGGNVMDGVCGILGITAGGVAVRGAMARLGMTVFFSVPLWGQVALAAGVVGCSFYNAMK